MSDWSRSPGLTARSFLLAVLVHVLFALAVGLNLMFGRPDRQSDAGIPTAPPIKAQVIDMAEVRRAEAEKRAAEDARLEAERKAEEERKQAAAEQKRKEEERQRKIEEEKERAEQEKQRKAEDARREKEAEEKKRKEEEQRKAEEAERKKREEAEQKRKEEEARKKKEAEEKKRQEEERRRAEEQRKAEEARKAREAEERRLKQELQAQLEREQLERQAVAAFGQYEGLIARKVSQNWTRPSGAQSGLTARFNVRVTRSGQVVTIKLVKSSGNPVFDRSAENAIYKASPLPIPGDPRLFEFYQEFIFNFAPDDI